MQREQPQAVERDAQSIEDLPDDVLQKCLSFLDGWDLCTVQQTSRRFLRLAGAQFLWHSLLRKEFDLRLEVKPAA